jgi:hypothetical protein
VLSHREHSGGTDWDGTDRQKREKPGADRRIFLPAPPVLRLADVVFFATSEFGRKKELLMDREKRGQGVVEEKRRGAISGQKSASREFCQTFLSADRKNRGEKDA